MMTSVRAHDAFTLIELLVVIAIILILIAIALPNFLDLMERAKVTEVRSELRTLAIGIESYGIQYRNNYPPSPASQAFGVPGAVAETWRITTPVSYLEEIPSDTFVEPPGDLNLGGPFGIGSTHLHYLNDPLFGEVWLTLSYGPDKDFELGTLHYSPTNGLLSDGDIYQVGAPQHVP